VTGFCEHGNELMGSMKDVAFLDQLTDSQFHKDSAPR
jgi:hypothetical protein